MKVKIDKLSVDGVTLDGEYEVLYSMDGLVAIKYGDGDGYRVFLIDESLAKRVAASLKTTNREVIAEDVSSHRERL